MKLTGHRGSWLPAAMVAVLIPAIAAMALYAVTIGGDFVFDDVHVIQVDDRPADVSQWGRYFTESYNDGVDNLFRPLTSLSFALQTQIHGRDDADAWAFHLVNIVLYGLVCGLVGLWTLRLAEGDQAVAVWVACAAGLLFAALPVHVEVVAGIVGRAELLCTLFFISGMVLLTSPLSPWRVAGFAGTMLLAIAAKEQGLLMPVVAGAWYLSQPRLRRMRLLNSYGSALALAIMFPLAGYLLGREQVLSMAWSREYLDPTIQPLIAAEGHDRWLVPIALAGRYLALLVWPATLSLDYGTAVISPKASVADPYLWLGLLAIGLWSWAVAWSLRVRWPAGIVLVIGFAAAYGVISNIPFLIGTIFGERLIFLPSLFLVVFLALLVARWVAGQGRGMRISVVVLVGSLLVAGAWRTLWYAVQWDDRLELYQEQARVQPRSVRIRMLLGDELRRTGRLEEAATHAEAATELAPDYWDGWVLRSDVARDAGDLERALEYIEKASERRKSMRTQGRWEHLLRLQDEAAATPSADPGGG